MILSVNAQTLLFFSTIAVGGILGFIYDIFRIFRRLFKHGNFLTQIEDLIYWLLASFIMFYFMLNENYGEIRIFSMIGALIGVILYFFAISPFVLKVSLTILNIAKQILTVTFKILFFPIKILLKILYIPYNFVKPSLLNVISNVKKLLQKGKTYAKIKKDRLKKDVNIILKKV